jgi:hypothetical protein
VSSAQDDPDNWFNKLQLRWKMLRKHRDTELYWFFDDDPASLSKNSGIITEGLLLLLVEVDIPTPPGVKWTGHSLRRGGASAAHAIGVSIMAWGLWKSLASALLYIDVSVRSSSLFSTCLRASIFLKRHSFHKLLQLLGARRST